MKTKIFLISFFLFINGALIIDNFDIKWSPSMMLNSWKAPFCFVINGLNLINGIRIISNDNYLIKNNGKFQQSSKNDFQDITETGSLSNYSLFPFRELLSDKLKSSSGIIFHSKSSKIIPEKFSFTQNHSNIFCPRIYSASDVEETNRVVIKIYNILSREGVGFVNENFFREIIL
jgi:hypothetical protein